MYHGEVNIEQDELKSFLAVAEDLTVKGLTLDKSSIHKNSHSTNSSMIAESMTNKNDIPENKNTTTILQNPNLEASKSTVDESLLCIKSGPPLQKTEHKDPITNYTAARDEKTSDIEESFGENRNKQ